MKMLKLVCEYSKKYKFDISFYIFIVVITWSFAILNPILIGKYLDILINHKNINYIINFIELLFFIKFVEVITIYFKSIISARIKTFIAFDLNNFILEHVKKLPLKYFRNTNTTYLNQRINSDSNMVVSFVFDNFLYVPFNVISFTLIVGYILFLRSKIFAISLLIIPIYVFLYLIFKKALYEKGYAFKEYQNKFFAKMNEQLYNIELIKINSWFEEQGNELKESFMVLFGRAMQYIKISAFYSNIDFTISGFVKLLVLLIGGTEVIRGRLTIGEIITIERYFDLLISNLSYFFNLTKIYQESLISYDRLNEIINIPIERNGEIYINQINEIELRNLNFSYTGDGFIISNFNYIFRKGNIYGIKGTNGIGKSTLIKLMLGLYQDYEGEIFYNSLDIKKLNMYNIRKYLIAVVEQEPTLLSSSIKNNILFGVSQNKIKNQDINYWFKKFNLYDFIIGLPNHYDYNIGENSKNISGGQKQKLAIIRALLKRPQIIILDEPTSSLDKIGKNVLIEILQNIKKDRIIIIITHDNDIFKICDEVIELSQKIHNKTAIN